MAISWKSHGIFTLDIRGVLWSIEVTRAILERNAGHELVDAELDGRAAGMAVELHEAAVLAVSAAPGPQRWVQLDIGDPHVPF